MSAYDRLLTAVVFFFKIPQLRKFGSVDTTNLTRTFTDGWTGLLSQVDTQTGLVVVELVILTMEMKTTCSSGCTRMASGAIGLKLQTENTSVKQD